MNMTFAKEKSIYSQALHIFMNLDNTEPERIEAYEIMQGVEEVLKIQGDEICTIVTTVNTNPIKDKTAPPMKFVAQAELDPAYLVHLHTHTVGNPNVDCVWCKA